MANLSNINNKFLVTTGGDVGIGITAPVEKLDTLNIAIGGSTITGYSANKLRIDNNGGNSRFYSTGGDASTTGSYQIHVTSSNGSINNPALTIASNTDATFAGNVGIGTTSPDRSLDVEGNGMAIIGTGGYTELMLRGQVEGTGTVRNVGAWQFSVRSDVGGNNDDLKLLRFITGSYEGTAIQVRSDTGGVAIGLNNQGYSSQILNVKSGAADNVFYGESTDANCFASFRDNSSTANIEYGAIANAHVFRSDTTEKMRITSDANVTFAKSADSNRDANSIKHADNDFLYILGGSAGVSLNDNGEDTRIILFDNSNIRFDVGSFDEAMTIAGSNGYVGIGTNVPARELHIKAADGAQIKLESTSTGDWSGIDLAAGNGSYSAYWGILDSNGNFFLDVGSNGTDLTVLQNGNVGIGTTSPTGFRLVVENTAEDLLKLHNSTDGLDSLISFTNPGGTLARIQGLDNGGLQFDTGNNAGGINTNAMFIDNTGNVGIGRTAPEFKLHVRGGSSTEETVLKLDKSATADSGGHTTILGLGTESGAWTKGAIGFERTGSYDRGKLHILMDNVANTSTVTLNSSVMTVHADGAFQIGSGHFIDLATNGQHYHAAGPSGLSMHEYEYYVDIPNGSTIDLFKNTAAYSDIQMVQISIVMYHSSRTYFTGMGTIGGYGFTLTGAGIGTANGGLTSAADGTGIRKLQISQSSGYTAAARIYIQIRTESAITVINGTLSTTV